MDMISIDRLYPHPKNPRRDVGDIAELTESIKANGIFQNLTVIKGGAGVPDDAEGYTVIIGHRRLAAAEGSRADGASMLGRGDGRTHAGRDDAAREYAAQ